MNFWITQHFSAANSIHPLILFFHILFHLQHHQMWEVDHFSEHLPYSWKKLSFPRRCILPLDQTCLESKQIFSVFLVNCKFQQEKHSWRGRRTLVFQVALSAPRAQAGVNWIRWGGCLVQPLGLPVGTPSSHSRTPGSESRLC